MTESKPAYVIVVAVDYSEAGDLALERAFELASEQPSAAVHVVNALPLFQNVVPDISSGGWIYALQSVDAASQQLKNYVEQKTNSFAERYQGRNRAFLQNVVAHQRLQGPAEEIAQLAVDLEADLIVMGTHSRHGVARLLLGSVAETTLRLAPCSVLVVRPKAQPEPVPAILPPCPKCLEARQASAGKELWCEQHRERHGQRHTYHQGDRVSQETEMPLVYRS